MHLELFQELAESIQAYWNSSTFDEKILTRNEKLEQDQSRNTNINKAIESGRKYRISEFIERLTGSEDKIKKYSLKTRKLNKDSMQDALGDRIFYVVFWKPLPKPIKRKVIELLLMQR